MLQDMGTQIAMFEDFNIAINYPHNASEYEKYMIWKKMNEIE